MICHRKRKNAIYHVKRNSPNAGTMLPLAFYRKDPHGRSLMIEINRKPYLDRTRADYGAVTRLRELAERAVGATLKA